MTKIEWSVSVVCACANKTERGSHLGAIKGAEGRRELLGETRAL